ncbi:MAG TPA: cell wall-binding repeat-containing protein [Acidimicrobiales bacterium]|nr:cell wall-binding repeat-containing protein [Acidimicrobiales bacterium]
MQTPVHKSNELVERRRRTRWLVAVSVGLAVAASPFLRSAEAATTASRVEGSDRYVTAANVSADAFLPGVPVAYVATGEAFPDALAGAAAAGKAGGPVLLTRPTSLPTATANELDRLKPGKIIVLGGTSAVSATVFDALDPYTDGEVTRIAGDDRYETAANLSAATFPTVPVNTVYVATGQDFPDALAGGPAAADDGGPILLVQGNSIPAATKTELTRLGATGVVLLGGPSAVSENVKDQLEAYSTAPVLRVAGADRYLTAVEVSENSFTSTNTVYLATGRNFPDALAGGPAAAKADGPMLLTQPNCIPPEVNAEITRLDPDSLIVLGGTAAVSDAVLNRTVCTPQSSSTFPTFPGGSFPTFPGGSFPTSFPSIPQP